MIESLLAAGWLLAAEDGEGPASPFSTMLPFFAIIMVLFWLIVIRPQKSKERDFKSMLANLKKNDRVVTIGGIHGVVTNVQKELDRVTIRVDESTGTTLRVGLSAIGRVVTDEGEDAEKTANKK